METFKKLTDIQHILLRPTMYIGKINEEPSNLFIYGKQKQVTYVPALLKLVNELIDNSNDEHLRSGRKFATKINITMTPESFMIEDNGRGIEVALYEGENVYKPQIAWCEARAGSSFSEDRVGAGSHGIGSFATNVFSKKFVGTSCDGKKKCVVTCTDNVSSINVKVTSFTKSSGTSVYFEPDFERFGVKEFSQTDIDIIKSRVEGLAVVYPTISYTFNKEKISFKQINKFLDRFGEKYVRFVTKNDVTIGVFPSDDCDSYAQYSIIDGLEFINGGTHEQYLSREISTALKDLIKKKHKLDMTLQEIKRGLKLVIVGSDFPNMLFDSQTKERLTNSEADIKNYFGVVNFDKIAKDIFNIPEIIEPIIEAKLAKQIAAEKRAITLEQKKMTKKYVEKHIPAKSKNVENTVLLLTEGLSASGMLEKVRDLEKHGCYPMRGCVKNTYGVKDKDILENKELNDIMTILGLKFHMSAKEIKEDLLYGKIGILADGDLDGSHISSLVINFFAKWEELFHQKKVFIVTSPRYIFTKNKGKKNEERVYCYDNKEYEEVRDKYKGWELRYIKGLGSLRPKEYRDVLDMTDRWLCVELDDKKCLDIMFSSNVEERRKIMGI